MDDGTKHTPSATPAANAPQLGVAAPDESGPRVRLDPMVAAHRARARSISEHPGAAAHVRATRPVTRRARARLRAQLWFDALGHRPRRVIDVLVAGGALLVLAPLFALVALAIKLDSRGPVFYRQERLGIRGRRFWMFKFRTMRVGADGQKCALIAQQRGALSGVRFKLRDDPRITRIGRYLRRFSVDELPQLWNVLRGQMTLVGPRPPVWVEVELYDVRALRRLEVRPGLTCLWQIGGRSDLTFAQQVDLDIEYIDTVRARDEFKIVARTIPTVLQGKGAY